MEARSLSVCLGVSWTATSGLREDPFDFRVWARDHVNRDQLADTPRGGRAGIRRRLDRADISSYQNGHIALADVLLADQDDVSGLDHRVGRFHRPNEPARFNHAKGF